MVHTIYTETGVQKGSCKNITDQGLWVPGMKKQQVLKVLFHKYRLGPEKLSSILEYMVNSLVGWLELVPKYHTKFNIINMYRVYVNGKVSNEYDYNCQTFLEHVPEALDSVPLNNAVTFTCTEWY